MMPREKENFAESETLGSTLVVQHSQGLLLSHGSGAVRAQGTLESNGS